jgi:hypothetical protein
VGVSLNTRNVCRVRRCFTRSAYHLNLVDRPCRRRADKRVQGAGNGVRVVAEALENIPVYSADGLIRPETILAVTWPILLLACGCAIMRVFTPTAYFEDTVCPRGVGVPGCAPLILAIGPHRQCRGDAHPTVMCPICLLACA